MKLFLRWGPLIIVLMSACGLPRDPNNTLNQVEDNTLRLGIVRKAPWTCIDGEQNPGGAEYELVKSLANELDAEIVWVVGTESELLKILSAFELDLVIGGLTPVSMYEGSHTYPYYTEEFIIGADSQSFDNIEGEDISVLMGTELASVIEDKGGNPVRVDELSPDIAPLAAPAWQIEGWGLQQTDIQLKKEKHVMAVPPGENGWLNQVDSFLLTYSTDEIEDLLENTSCK